MKFFIASDLHGSEYYLNKLLEKYREEGADKLLLLGDILYHGPRNDLPLEYNTKYVMKTLNEMKDEIIAVRGNCDAEVDQMVLEFPMMADYAIILSGDKTIFATHGHKYNLKNLPPFAKDMILLHGHTHVTKDVVENGVRYINPGSISMPKEDTGHGYIILEDGNFTFKNIE